MRSINFFKVLSTFFVTAYLLAACGGTTPQTTTSAKSPKVEANVVAFTGTVESINGNEWTVSGQKFTLDPQASFDPHIAVGDKVKVEARVSAGNGVIATRVESSGVDDTASSLRVNVLSPDGIASSAQAVSAPQVAANENEVFGTVEAITADTITVDGVTYNLTNATEIQDALTVGDPVKLHVTVNADGTVTVREIEKSVASFDDNDSNSGGVDEGPNHDLNDDKFNENPSDDGPNHDSNDDHGGSSGSGNSGSGG